jgi:D-alanine-D-alanine ligase-like ATP-grasp enzyme/GNAT superfamily N-acetyltransferase
VTGNARQAARLAIPGGLRVAVLYGAVSPAGAADEQDVLLEVETACAALTALGARAWPVPLTLDLEAARRALRELAPDRVFNLVESVDGRGALLALGAGLLEGLGLPYTGAPLAGLVATSNKLEAKRLLARTGVATPPWVAGVSEQPARAWPGPWIVKSVWEHASIGIDDDALLPDLAGARARLAERLAGQPGGWFAEAFVEGRELNVSLLGAAGSPQVLPVAEIRFDAFPPGKPRIVGYPAKWEPESFEFANTPRSFACTAEDAALLAELRGLALRCWELFGLRGYARVDFRVDARGQPWVLEVNANPCLSPDAGYLAAAREAGLGVDEVVARILADCPAVDGPTPPGAAGAPAEAPALAGPQTPDILHRDEVGPADLDRVRRLVEATGFFTAAEVGIAVELVQERLARGPASGYEFVLAERAGELLGYACFGPVPGTRASYDLYWVAVAPGEQGRGVGRYLVAAAETAARARGGTRMYAETSARPQYEPTRRFYRAVGYTEAAYLPEFYAPGDGKLVYCRVLSGPRA